MMLPSHERAATCPARLGGRSARKRDSDSMSIWQLQEAFSSDLAPPVLATRVDSYRSVASSECSDYGSWPRVRKQRTNEVMSLTELTAAFEEANSAASTSLGGQVDLLDATTAALAEDAEA